MAMPENVTALPQRPRSAATEQLLVSDSARPDELRRLLESLLAEDCVHSWRNFGPEGTADELLRWENERRPTMLFFFHLQCGGTMRLVAASAVADRLTRDFPHTGFPVLGRCYILPEYRNRGFYRQILRFRLEHCRAEYGSSLNAIHLGAVNQRISSVISNHGLAGWSRFIHLGEEELQLRGDISKVGAYLLLQPNFLSGLQAAVAGGDAPPCVVALRKALAGAESGDVRNLGMLVKESFAEACGLGWFDARDTRGIEQLLLFCNSVPLVGFR